MQRKTSSGLCQIYFSHTRDTYSLFTYSLLLLIHLRLVRTVRTTLHRVCIITAAYHQQDQLILGLWRPRTFKRGQTRTEQNTGTAPKSHNQHLHVLPTQQNRIAHHYFSFLTTANYTILEGWQLGKCFGFFFFHDRVKSAPTELSQFPTECKPNAKHNIRHYDDNFPAITV